MRLRLFKSCALTLMLAVTFAVLSSPASAQENVSQTCAQLGFKPGSRGHTDCVNQNSGVGGRVAPKPANPAPAAKAPVVPELTAAQREDKFWEDAKAAGNKEAFEAYLERYPNGLHVGLARANIARLSPANIPPPVPANKPVPANNRPPGTTFKDCPDCPEMVAIPAGRFVMGAAPGEEEREKVPEQFRNRSQPQFWVDVASFSAGKFEVTRGQYRAFAQATGRSSNGCFVWTGAKFEHDPSKDWRNPGYVQEETHPAACVSWNDASAYVTWLSQKTGKNYRLLSEAEWEYAARAGTTTTRFWGDDVNMSCGYANGSDLTAHAQVPGFDKFVVANCNDRYAYTAPVGSYRPNAFGLYDVLGNVWEWTQDCWNENYSGAPADGSASGTGNCSQRVVRGGSWFFNPQFLRAAFRLWDSTAVRGNFGGFRVARTD